MKATLVPILLQNSLKLSESNCFPLSTVRVLSTSNLQITLCQKNFFTVFDVILVSGLASIHLVKYSMATTANWFPLAMVVVAQPGPFPIFEGANWVG